MLWGIAVQDGAGREATVEVLVRRDTVELRLRDALVGVADREDLRRWLRHPVSVFAYDDLAWIATPTGIALAIDDVVPPWPLPDHVAAGLRERV
jgi:hypothetical protein